MALSIIVANWKMYFSYQQGVQFAHAYGDELVALSKKHNRLMVLCPSFELLYPVTQLIPSSSFFAFGAQDCSASLLGAHTGQVSALSLAQLGCAYCIVGHNERRREYSETSEVVAQKVVRLLEQGITPIVCIGEDEHAYRAAKIYEVLEQQLKPIVQMIASRNACLYYAYEPVWAIGSGIVPDSAYLKNIFSWLANYLAAAGQSGTLLYGGSVTSEALPMLATLEELGGVLVGGASVDFQKFKNIVSWSK